MVCAHQKQREYPQPVTHFRLLMFLHHSKQNKTEQNKNIE